MDGKTLTLIIVLIPILLLAGIGLHTILYERQILNPRPFVLEGNIYMEGQDVTGRNKAYMK